MKQLTAALVALTLATPALAQDEDGQGRINEGWGMLSEGTRLLLEGLADEMRPLVDEHLLPMLAELSALIDDVAMYEMPEILPNGDIIIRRREAEAEPESGDTDNSEAPPVEAPVDL